jgi:hypothetical protein
MTTPSVNEQRGVGSAAFFNWKAKYSGLDVPDPRELRRPEAETVQLKSYPPTASRMGRS